jgi:protein-S-isoprenylcysteine O-methyltransferase Ste14
MPPERLVITGSYRYVRNPMYVALVSIVLGEALLLGQRVLLVYALLIWVCFQLFVLAYEEPTLKRRYGQQYENYRRSVRRWLPRARPWQVESQHD